MTKTKTNPMEVADKAIQNLDMFHLEQIDFIKNNLVPRDEMPRQFILSTNNAKQTHISDTPQPTLAGDFKARFYKRSDDQLMVMLGRSVAKIDIDLIGGSIDVVLRDSAGGLMMRSFVQAYGEDRVNPIGAIEMCTNPDLEAGSSIIRYAITRIVEHKLSYDYACNDCLHHKLRFEFHDFGVVDPGMVDSTQV